MTLFITARRTPKIKRLIKLLIPLIKLLIKVRKVPKAEEASTMPIMKLYRKTIGASINKRIDAKTKMLCSISVLLP